MKNRFLIILTYILVACETVIDFDLPVEQPELVLNSFFDSDGNWKAIVSKTQHILDDADHTYFTDAEVVVYDGDKQLFTFDQPTPDNHDITVEFYKANFIPEAGKEYTIRVEKDGFESIKTTTKAIEQVPILDIVIDSVSKINEGHGGGRFVDGPRIIVEVTFQDDPGNENFYGLEITKDQINQEYYQTDSGTHITSDTLSQKMVIETEGIIVDQAFEYGNELIFPDATFNGKKHTVKVAISAHEFYRNSYYIEEEKKHFKQSLNFHIKLKHINSDYYKYKTATILQSWTSGDPFAEPVFIYNNIEGGLGIFAAYGISEKMIRFE